MKQLTRALGLAACLFGTCAAQADTLRVGFVSTLSGPASVAGLHMRDGFMLGVNSRNGTVGGRPTVVIEIDDKLNPEVARQEVKDLLAKDKIDIVVGGTYPSIVRAIQQPVLSARMLMVATGAGPAMFAGPGCNPNYFSVAPQSDQPHEAMGRHATQEGYRDVVVIAPKFVAGQAAVAAFKRHFNGNVVAEIYTELGKFDFSDELKQVGKLKPDAVYTFMPGGMGISLVRQFTRFGMKYRIPFLSAETITELTLPETMDSAIDLLSAAGWAPDLDNTANKVFVRSFLKSYGYMPSHYAAQGYDAARLLDAAYQMAGKGADQLSIRTALEAAPFQSVRGDFKFNKNHFPIQDYYLARAVKAGSRYSTQVVQKLFDDVGDAYAGSCRMSSDNM
ncbi:MAG: penicillin-binding protein activator [Rhodobacteraceae bacterium]|nr:penicillin-binding protein activator [Paracoccaceae bacterium]